MILLQIRVTLLGYHPSLETPGVAGGSYDGSDPGGMESGPSASGVLLQVTDEAVLMTIAGMIKGRPIGAYEALDFGPAIVSIWVLED